MLLQGENGLVSVPEYDIGRTQNWRAVPVVQASVNRAGNFRYWRRAWGWFPRWRTLRTPL